MRKLVIFCLLLSGTGAFAQKMSKFRLPSAEAAVYDNNGNDLKWFVNKYKAEIEDKAKAVTAASDAWHFVMMKNIIAPATNKEGVLNYTEPFNITLAVSATTSPEKATWWGREYNSSKGKLIHYKTAEEPNLGIDLVRYNSFINEVSARKVCLVEYVDTVTNMYDFDELFKNNLFIKRGAIQNVAHYAKLVNFYNAFLSHFSATTDAALEEKSYIIFFKGETEYVGYVNYVNNKLCAVIMQPESEFETDRLRFTNDMFRKITGKTVYLYGDNYFGMEKMIRKRAESAGIDIRTVTTKTAITFNKEIQ